MPEKHHPTPEERDERLILPLPPDQAIAAILAAGPHPEEAPERRDADRQAPSP